MDELLICQMVLAAGCAVRHLPRTAGWHGFVLCAPGVADEASGQVQEPSSWHQAEENLQVHAWHLQVVRDPAVYPQTGVHPHDIHVT